jgi:hypothetical protein
MSYNSESIALDDENDEVSDRWRSQSPASTPFPVATNTLSVSWLFLFWVRHVTGVLTCGFGLLLSLSVMLWYVLQLWHASISFLHVQCSVWCVMLVHHSLSTHELLGICVVSTVWLVWMMRYRHFCRVSLWPKWRLEVLAALANYNVPVGFLSCVMLSTFATLWVPWGCSSCCAVTVKVSLNY